MGTKTRLENWQNNRDLYSNMADIFDTLDQSQGDIFDQIAPESPVKKIGQTVIGPKPSFGQNVLNLMPNWRPEAIPEAINKQPQIVKDLETIPTNFLNQFSLNHLRSFSNSGNVPIPFEAKNPVINAVAKGAGIAGAITNPVTRAIAGAGGMVKSALGFGAAGASYAPTENPFDVKQRALQGGFAAVTPFAMKGAEKGSKIIGKGIDAVKKSSADYVTSNIAPRAYQIYQDAVDSFTPQIQRFAENKLGIPKSVVETIKSQGMKGIDNVRTALKDSTDSIYQKLEGGIVNIRNQADRSYQMAMDSAPEGKVINIKPSIESAGRKLKDLGLITKTGNLTELGQSEIARDSVYGKLLDFYKSADSISGVKGMKSAGAKITTYKDIFGNKTVYPEGDLTFNQGKKLMDSTSRTLVNKGQYQFFRDKLNALYKGKPSDVDVGDVVNQFYKDGEVSGIKGLQNARALQRKAFSIEDKFQNSPLIKERKLNNYHNLTEQEKRSLNELQSLVGVNVNDELSAVSAGKYIDKLREYNQEKFTNDLNKAIDPKWTNHVYKQYKDLLGFDANKIFDEIVTHRNGLKIKKTAKWATGLALGGGVAAGGYNKVFGN